MLRIFKQYYPIRNIFFVIGEGLVIFLSVIIAFWIYTKFNPMAIDHWLYLKAFFITIIFQISLYYNDLYDLQIIDTLLELGVRLLESLGAATILLGLICFFFPQIIIGQKIFIISLALVIVLIVSWRFGYRHILKAGMFNQKIIILGSSELSCNIIKEIEEKKDCGYTVSLSIGDDPDPTSCKQYQIDKTDYTGICKIAKERNIKKIIVALKEKRGRFPVKELLNCRVNGIEVLEGTSFYEMLTGKLIVEHINPTWLIFSEGFRKSRTRRFLKRTVDLLISLIMLILLLPLLVIIAILIKLDSRGPVIYSQERVGENRSKYMVHKFRSMVENAESESGPVWASEKDTRVTKVGGIIRKLRFDEFPQLWNVLKGEMSFVGPRPEREHFVKDLEEQIPYFGERFVVKPGITGWAQVCYGYGASVEDAVEKLNYDLFYIKNMSTFMDLMIVLRTIKTVLFKKGSR